MAGATTRLQLTSMSARDHVHGPRREDRSASESRGRDQEGLRMWTTSSTGCSRIATQHRAARCSQRMKRLIFEIESYTATSLFPFSMTTSIEDLRITVWRTQQTYSSHSQQRPEEVAWTLKSDVGDIRSKPCHRLWSSMPSLRAALTVVIIE